MTDGSWRQENRKSVLDEIAKAAEALAKVVGSACSGERAAPAPELLTAAAAFFSAPAVLHALSVDFRYTGHKT